MKKWNIVSSIKDSSHITPDQLQEILLHNRGIISEEEKSQFLRPDLSSITVDGVGINKNDLIQSFDRIKKAIEQKEQIIVYGDYDVDGITGTAILWESLQALGARVMPYIPHRVEEGYGLSVKGIENLLTSYPHTSLIITVDNGIVANAAVDFAQEKNIDVIITDHHVSDEENTQLPHAFSIVHTTKLCGAGVAWLVVHELYRYLGQTLKSDNLLELAALATVADLVPLQGESRAIVYHGLEKLHQTKRTGLVALMRHISIDQSTIGVYEIGHMIAPRLNATGRLESAMDSLRLLCTKDSRKAEELAHRLNQINSERQRIMIESVAHASNVVKTQTELKKLLIVSHESYQEGVIGLIAGKLVEEYYRPAIVIAKGEKVSKGSVRSIQGFNIIQFLRKNSEFFVNVGGHPMAAGFTIETEKIELFQKTLEDLAHLDVTEDLLTRSLTADCQISLNVISPELYTMISILEPFGMGNPQPVFVSGHVLVRDVLIMGKDGKHLRLILQQDDHGKIFEAVAFGMAERVSELQIDSYIDIAYTLDENTWGGNTKLQLKIRDFRSESK